jgi:hypothetical protein
MMSLGSKLTALPFHPTKKVNKAEEITYLSTNNELKSLNEITTVWGFIVCALGAL